MIVVQGQDVYTDIEELVDPSHTALLVIDMQYDFVDPGGLQHVQDLLPQYGRDFRIKATSRF